MSSAGRVPIIVLAGVASGVGKTTITLGLAEALRRRGFVVQAFKVGPDFIDPAFHALATGRPCYNLDGFMCDREGVIATVARRAADADLALVEGVMGCFDGVEGGSETGSTAQIAKWLAAPVVLVADAGAMARSAAAVVLGFERFDPELVLDGVIFDRAGGALHRRWLHEAVAQSCKARVLGTLPHDRALSMPERHLGLVTAAEGSYSAETRARLASLIEAHVDVDALRALARSAVERRPSERRAAASSRDVTIAVARDEAFQFYYADNLERLEAAGARLTFWSPLRDRAVPPCQGLYIGGGYPELHGRALSENTVMRHAVKAFAAAGAPVYAECGGLMYLAESLTDADGRRWPMVGLFPGAVTMAGNLTLGYREVHTLLPTLLGPAGTRARGHEFHCSALTSVPDDLPRAYSLTGGGDGARREGFVIGRSLLSYVHLHWGSNPELPGNFVAACGSPC